MRLAMHTWTMSVMSGLRALIGTDQRMILMTLTPEHIKAMQEGRRRAAATNKNAGAKRVADYTAWLKAGSNLLQIPEIPKDSDYPKCIE
jgi:uncharacterized protein with GYD domain